MDFFSKLGKKASETYQITKEKATTLTEELKLKSKISDAKDDIEELYKEIGKKVFEEVKSGNDVVREEILEKVEKISELKQKIEKTEVEILALKKIKKCPNCSAELELNADFCSKCGQKQEKSQKPEEKVEIHEEENIKAEEAEVVEVKDVESTENLENTQNMPENEEGSNEG